MRVSILTGCVLTIFVFMSACGGAKKSERKEAGQHVEATSKSVASPSAAKFSYKCKMRFSIAGGQVTLTESSWVDYHQGSRVQQKDAPFIVSEDAAALLLRHEGYVGYVHTSNNHLHINVYDKDHRIGELSLDVKEMPPRFELVTGDGLDAETKLIKRVTVMCADPLQYPIIR